MESKFDTIQPVHSPSLQSLSLRRRVQRGFTLIELMIVVAIVGILAAIAVPQYQDYIARTQFAEGITLASAQKAAVTEAFSHRDACPDNSANSDAGIPKAADMAGSYVEKVVVGTANEACTITSTFKSAGIAKGLQKKTVTLTMGDATKGAITWACTSNADKKYLPQSCATAAATGGGTGGGGTGGGTGADG